VFFLLFSDFGRALRRFPLLFLSILPRLRLLISSGLLNRMWRRPLDCLFSLGPAGDDFPLPLLREKVRDSFSSLGGAASLIQEVRCPKDQCTKQVLSFELPLLYATSKSG